MGNLFFDEGHIGGVNSSRILSSLLNLKNDSSVTAFCGNAPIAVFPPIPHLAKAVWAPLVTF